MLRDSEGVSERECEIEGGREREREARIMLRSTVSEKRTEGVL